MGRGKEQKWGCFLNVLGGLNTWEGHLVCKNYLSSKKPVSTKTFVGPGLTNGEHGKQLETTDARHVKPRLDLDCRVLPPGEFNSMILEPLAVCYQSFMR